MKLKVILTFIQLVKVSVSGNIPGNPAALDGRQGIRIFEPCNDPAGAGCEIFEDEANIHLAEKRWYPSAIRIFDGSLVSNFEVILSFSPHLPHCSGIIRLSWVVNTKVHRSTTRTL